MAKLICEDCGEVLEDGLTEAEAEELADQYDAEDHRHDADGEKESEEGDGGGEGLEDREDVEDLDDELEDEFEDKVDELADQEEIDDVEDDLQNYQGAEAEVAGDFEVLVGNGEEIGPTRQGDWEDAVADAQPVSDLLRDHLRQMKRDRDVSGKRSGSFDSSRMIQADRGSARVFEQRHEGDTPDYEAYFILDRSGSMSAKFIPHAEHALASLAIALEDVGIDAEIVDFYRSGGYASESDVRLVNSMSQDPEEEKGNIMSGAANGGTPLGEVVDLLADRIEANSDPFVVIITDGEPASADRYLEAVQDLNDQGVEVLGVTLGNPTSLDQEDFNSMYNAHVRVERHELTEIGTRIQDLIRDMVL
jgi:hypothetical protein